MGELERRNESPHTIRNYEADRRDFAAYFTPPDASPPAPADFDVLTLREWLAHLYDRELKPPPFGANWLRCAGCFECSRATV